MRGSGAAARPYSWVRHACVPVFSPNASQATGVRPVNASEKETFMAPRWDGGGVWFTYISCDDFSYLAFSLVGARLARDAPRLWRSRPPTYVVCCCFACGSMLLLEVFRLIGSGSRVLSEVEICLQDLKPSGQEYPQVAKGSALS